MDLKAEEFTEMAWGSILQAQKIAIKKKHQQLETEHIILSIIETNDLAKRILEKTNASIKEINLRLQKFIENQPKMLNMPEKIYIGKSIYSALDEAERIKNTYEDNFISSEHLLLSLAKDNRCGMNILKESNVKIEALRSIINEPRGTQKVIDQNP